MKTNEYVVIMDNEVVQSFDNLIDAEEYALDSAREDSDGETCEPVHVFQRMSTYSATVTTTVDVVRT